MENGSDEHIAFLENLQVVAFKEQLEEAFNKQCHMCNKCFLTCFYLDELCSECHDDVEQLIEEFNHE